MPITSRQNPIVRQFREAAQGGARVLLDGEHLISEALDSAVPVDTLAIAEDAREGMQALAARAERAGARVVTVTAAVLDAMTPVRQPSGIVAIGRRMEPALHEALAGSPPLVLILDQVQDPGNLGAIVRAADAFGVTGIVAGQGCADPMGWKALRGSMGSIFRVPVAAKQSLPAAISAARALDLQIFAAVPRDGVTLAECDLRQPAAILLGGEGSGLSEELSAPPAIRLTIPMRPPVESLNVAMAAALIAYESQRQRKDLSS